MSLTSLKSLLRLPGSHDVFRQAVAETSRLYREDSACRWYFLLLSRVFAELLENPGLIDPDTAEPVLRTISEQALNGTEAIERGDMHALTSAANQITEAYCGMP